jgi:hypothetical protein
MKLRQFVAGFLVVLSAHAAAEQSTLTQYLIAQSPSLLDFGMARLNDQLRSHAVSKYFAVLAADYSLDENAITIRGRGYFNAVTTVVEAKQWCTEMVLNLKTVFGYDRVTGEAIFPQLGLGTYFRHHNYSSTSTPQDLEQLLAKAAKIRIDVRIRERNDLFKCESKLAEKSIQFSE